MIGETALHPDAFTGRWDYSSLPENVCLGRDCFIETKASFERFRSLRDNGLVLGDRVKVFNWTTFNIEPAGQLVVGSDCILVGPAFMCADQITIGRGVTISYSVTIADCDFHPVDPDLRRRDAIAISPFGDKMSRPRITTGPVEIADDVWIGIGAIILKGVKIGKAARVGAGTVVTRDIPEGVRVFGNPATKIEHL
jgi:acetyltransferase-like isoleucine patch superfamily enzyme